MKLSSVLFIPVSLLILGGCTSSIHMVNTAGSGLLSLSDTTYKYVEAKSQQTVVLGFVFDTDYVNAAKQSLIEQCEGDLVAVTTQYSTEHNFMHWKNKILMKGICT